MNGFLDIRGVRPQGNNGPVMMPRQTPQPQQQPPILQQQGMVGYANMSGQPSTSYSGAILNGPPISMPHLKHAYVSNNVANTSNANNGMISFNAPVSSQETYMQTNSNLNNNNIGLQQQQQQQQQQYVNSGIMIPSQQQQQQQQPFSSEMSVIVPVDNNDPYGPPPPPMTMMQQPPQNMMMMVPQQQYNNGGMNPSSSSSATIMYAQPMQQPALLNMSPPENNNQTNGIFLAPPSNNGAQSRISHNKQLEAYQRTLGVQTGGYHQQSPNYIPPQQMPTPTNLQQQDGIVVFSGATTESSKKEDTNHAGSNHHAAGSMNFVDDVSSKFQKVIMPKIHNIDKMTAVASFTAMTAIILLVLNPSILRSNSGYGNHPDVLKLTACLGLLAMILWTILPKEKKNNSLSSSMSVLKKVN